MLTKKHFAAGYILTSPAAAQPLVENGELIVDTPSGKILSVLKRDKKNHSASKKAAGFQTIIIPGFINSHTHTDLMVRPKAGEARPSDKTQRVFSEWVLSLVKIRDSLDLDQKNRLRIKAFSEFVKSGTTLIGDIIETDSFYNIGGLLLKSELIPRVKGFIELRGLDPAGAPAVLSEFKAFYEKYRDVFKKNENYFSLGISPHSIYSVSEGLFRGIIKENSSRGLKIAIHASEHLSETEFISGRGGDIAVNLLPEFKLSKFSKPLKTFPTPIAYLNYLKILNKNTSIIHANEINEVDIEIIKKSGANIIHCPRSNAFFNSKKLPLKKILEKGITVSLGTDSLYSNKTLSILDELRYAKKIHPGVSSKDLFSMATINGAKALAFPNVTGTLEPASYGDFIVFKMDKNIRINEGNIYDNILSLKKSGIIRVVMSGNVVYNNPD
ncbi:MAG: amidohydrolase family protein [Deltaproteobacteria bacterium]|nr:amidohydrolase family protein [Deltaproteobacteria bacterium]